MRNQLQILKNAKKISWRIVNTQIHTNALNNLTGNLLSLAGKQSCRTSPIPITIKLVSAALSVKSIGSPLWIEDFRTPRQRSLLAAFSAINSAGEELPAFLRSVV